MGLLDSLVQAGLSQALGGGRGNSGLQGQLIQLVLKQVLGGGNQSGGLGSLTNLVQMFQKNGMGDAVNSWVGQGQNQECSAQQIEQGFDASILTDLASQLGASKQDTASELSNILPGLIDKLTPQGQADDGLGLDDAIGMLGKLMK